MTIQLKILFDINYFLNSFFIKKVEKIKKIILFQNQIYI